MNDLRNRVRRKLSTLTKSQKAVANFMVENPQKFALSSIRQLEKELTISKSSIVRFAQALGYRGFAELKSEFWQGMRNNLGPLGRYKSFLQERHGKVDFLRLMAEETTHNIQKTLELIDPLLYKKALKMIKEASHVYTIGVGISSCLAEFAAYLLNRISVNSVHLTCGPLKFTERIINLPSSDIILAFSFPPYSKETIEAARYARERGIRVISVTDKVTNEIVQHSDVSLQVVVESITISNSIMSVLVLLYSLMAQLGDELKPKTLKTIQEIEHVRKEHL